MDLPDESPNILWIITDQERDDTIQALGNAHIRTPNLDRPCAEDTVPWSNSIIRQAARREDCAFSEGVIRVREDLAIEIKRDRLLIQPSYTCLLGLYWIASARCAVSIFSLPARSAIVRASFRMRW